MKLEDFDSDAWRCILWETERHHGLSVKTVTSKATFAHVNTPTRVTMTGNHPTPREFLEELRSLCDGVLNEEPRRPDPMLCWFCGITEDGETPHKPECPLPLAG